MKRSLVAALYLCPVLPASAVTVPAIHAEYNASLKAQIPLEQGWQNPPRLARTRVWWWWLNGQTDKETITRDLEAMKAAGMGGANIIDAGGDTQEGNRRVPHGPDFGSPEWRKHFTHAVAEADRLGLELGFNIQSGWNLGGPKVTVEESSKKITFSRIGVDGGKLLELPLAAPPAKSGFYREIAVLAVPLPADAPPTGTPITKIRQLDQKAYFNYPGAFTATEAWHLLQDDPASPTDQVCPPGSVVDLTRHMTADGKLRWNAPAGKWEILRFGYTSTGAHVSTHSENAGGLAIDYLDRRTLETYWKNTLEPIFRDVRPYLGKSLRFLHTDSWELGPVNWTAKFPEEFKQRRGYEVTCFLPVLAGHVIGSRDISNRFLNDFRRTLADLMADHKYQGFAELAHSLGLGIHPESGGPHAGPMDALRNLGINDVPMGEFWSPSPRHRVNDDQRFFVKQTTSAAHTYGRRVSLAEAFTNIGRHWQHDPRSLKSTFDRAACEGHNLTMWHTFSSSPRSQGLPGSAYFAGEHLNPNVTWWPQAHAFISYLNRCHFLLQQGLPANDVLHFYGENIPSFVRLKRDDPARCLPGYDYDVIDSRALLDRCKVDANGWIVLPEGTRYRLLSLVRHNAISLPVLQHIASLAEQGATVVGPRPGRPFSLSGGEAADRAFTSLCDRMWGASGSSNGIRKFGKGRVIGDASSREVLQADGVAEDFSWKGGDKNTFIDFIHRRTDDTEIFFVANRNARVESLELRFRVSGKVPEFWDPVSGSRRDATDFRSDSGVTLLPYTFQPEEAFFVMFRKSAGSGVKSPMLPNVPTYQTALELAGPWSVSFDPAWGGPETIEFERLVDWTARPEEGIRHYSGAATYRKSFATPQISGPVFLDLGMVESLCEVKLNGQELGVLWSFPFRTEITPHLRPGGENQLEIKVVNLWCNRIIGDAKLPEGQRHTKTNITRLTANTPLEPSGLLGPVRLVTPQ